MCIRDRDIAVGGIGEDLIGLRDSAFHAVGPGRKNDLGTKGQEQHAALKAHSLRQSKDEPVAFDRGDECQRNSCISTCGLNENCLAGSDLAGFFSGVDHCEADTVFYAGNRILAFQFGNDGSGESSSYPVQPNQRGAANEFSYIRGNARHDVLLFRGLWPRSSNSNGLWWWWSCKSGESAQKLGRTFASELSPGRC